MGVVSASAAMGALSYVVIKITVHVQAETFPELYGALMGSGCREAIHVLHGLICLLTAAAMLSAASELGGLALSWKFSRPFGLLLTLFAAIIMICVGMNALSVLGAILVPFVVVFYLATATGPNHSVCFSWNGAFSSIPLGLLYAAFNVALTGGAICQIARWKISPEKTGFLTGVFMFLMLSCANLALLKADVSIRESLLPSVMLTKKWGIFGYYISIALMWLSILTTLCAMLSSIQRQLISAGIKSTPALAISVIASSLTSTVGFRTMVNVAYPLLGWICSFALIALLLFLPNKGE